MMKTTTTVTLLAIVVLALAACVAPAAPVAVTPQAATPETVPPAAVPALAGTSWVLSSLGGSLPLQGATVTLQFNTDGSATGSDGCNRFRTTYTQSGASLTFKQPAASTMMACPEPVMNQATAFMAALAGTTDFTASDRQLILRAGAEILATFVADSQSLAGTAWDVISYNNGREAVVSLLPGIEITANFGANGEVTGNAGCNEYFASYSVNGNAIEIGTPGSTFRFCPEPAGVMDQEFEYLKALQSAATYSIQGDLLEMRTAADQTALVMIRKAILDLPAPAPEPATPKGRVVGTQSLNVRSGPGANFPIIGAARAGDEGEIIGRSADGGWWAVSVPSAPGGVGWVSVDFVLATNVENVPVIAAPPPPPPAPTSPPPPPTPTPLPQATATPSAEIAFWADRTSINQGQCATLNWSVQNVQAVWVYPRGAPYSQFPRTGQGSEQVCPSITTTYEMRVLMRDGSTTIREVTINVTPAAPTATPVPAPTATPAPAPDPLAGTRWEVVNYNNGRGAVVTLVPDTRISMDFGTDGQVTGRAGCNNYFASYRASGASITIGPPGSTSMLCAEPEGVMDQEAEFLAALQSAATFHIDGNMLEMRSAADQIAIVASRAP
jgi:heat shock protein HslJ